MMVIINVMKILCLSDSNNAIVDGYRGKEHSLGIMKQHENFITHHCDNSVTISNPGWIYIMGVRSQMGVRVGVLAVVALRAVLGYSSATPHYFRQSPGTALALGRSRSRRVALPSPPLLRERLGALGPRRSWAGGSRPPRFTASIGS